MTLPSLNIINTHVKTKPKNNCFKKRPCYRSTCRKCLKAKANYIAENLYPKLNELEIDQHSTITFLSFQGCGDEAFDLLLNVRSKMLRKTRKIAPIICCLSVAQNSVFNSQLVPHFHLLSSCEITTSILKAIISEISDLKLNIYMTPLEQTEASLRRLINYWLDRNYRPTSIIKPRGIQLITGPRGVKLGRPKYQRVPAEYILLTELLND